jgi:hypothetical protein
MITRRERNDTALALLCGQLNQAIIGTTEFKRADVL